MKKFYALILLFGLIAGFLSSCSDNKCDCEPTPPVGNTPLAVIGSGDFSIELTDTLVLRADVISASEISYSWTMNNNEVSTDSIYVFKADRGGIYKVKLTAKSGEESITKTASITVRSGRYKHGTFILNEGLVATHGSLLFINPEGAITDNVYFRENGEYLGEVCQDLYIKNNKLYIISQNGGNGGGFITICNAETMKKERSFHNKFITQINSTLIEETGKYEKDTTYSDWPTHIAILGDDDVYLRDNKGIFLIHPSTVAQENRATFIKGTKYARKNTMAVADGKVFASLRRTVVVIEQDKDTISHTIAFGKKNISGLVRATDGNLWASDEDGIIYKISPKTHKIIAQNQLEGEAATLLKIKASQPAAPNFAAKGDTIYISNTTTTIYRHIFSQNATKLMVDAKTCIPADPDYFVGSPFTVYNTCAVHPITGEVILNTLKGWGAARHTNHTTFFDFSHETYPRIARDYANYTDYPANVFFTYNFE